MLLTLSIATSKKSVVNKLSRAVKTFQQFKNLLYLCALEYYKDARDVKPFLSRSFLEKFVKDKVELPAESEQIKKWKQNLAQLWKEEIGSDTAKALVGMVAKEIRSVLAKWKNGQKSKLPRPRKLGTLYSFTLETNPNMVVDKRTLTGKRKSDHIVVRLGKAFGAVKFKIPRGLNVRHIKINWHASGEVTYLVNYEVEKSGTQLSRDLFLALDLGVKNLIAVISNKETLPSFVVNGNPLKSFNQWTSKMAARLQSEGKESACRKLWKYRQKRINQLLGAVSNFVVSLCLREGIGRLILSDSLTDEYQKEGKKGRKLNQTFRQIPLGRLIQKFEYKCQLAGIEVLREPEPFTSQLSAITGNIEEISGRDRREITEADLKRLHFTGKRVKRGLFKDLKLNKVFNADLNGALNVAIKKLGSQIRKEFLKLPNWLDKLSRPVRLTFLPHDKYSASPLFMRIADSNSYLIRGSEGHLLTGATKCI